MGIRTNDAAVQGVLGLNYDVLRKPDLTPYIGIASNLIDLVVTKALTLPTPVTIVAATAELMERWAAAAYYCKMDPNYASQSQGGASGSYITTEKEQQFGRYMAGAIDIDPSGCLKAQLLRNTAGGVWLGKPEGAQVPYRERN